MIKRLHIYFKERYPIIPRLILGIIVFLEIHFIILLNQGVTKFHIGVEEFVGAFTVFAFLLWLRIADDLKDFETDKALFPDRPLPSGRVYKKDVVIACIIVQAITVALNVIFMWDSIIFFVILYIYGYLMSKWFFQ
ncbi:MAG: prenyltransferase, partial [Clostridiales bacterium]|nr:prenyltransferase [Clostridiales bacterium]